MNFPPNIEIIYNYEFNYLFMWITWESVSIIDAVIGHLFGFFIILTIVLQYCDKLNVKHCMQENAV